MFQGFTDSDIRRLNRISKQMQNVTVRIPSHRMQEKALEEISNILQGDGRVNISYARNVLFALQYARVQYHKITGHCMLYDIRRGKRIILRNYSKL